MVWCFGVAWDVKFPDVGEGITEGQLVKWLVQVGDVISRDQAVAEIETDKAIVEIPSPHAGKVLALHGAEGDVIKVGSTLAVIGGEEEKVEMVEAKVEEGVKPGRVLATPHTRKLARELGVDITQVEGSGPGGRITDEDVKKAAEKPSEAPQVEKEGEEVRVPLSPIRKRIAENMTRSAFTMPHVTAMDEADVTELVELREQQKASAEKAGVKLTFLPFIIKAVVIALKEHPYFNASLDMDRGELVIKKYYNIGVAVDTPEGLLVPVIKDIEHKSILELAAELNRLAEEARNRKIKLEDLKGSSFTITNVGAIGGMLSTPLINPPNTAILGVHRIKERPVVKDGEIKIRKMLYLSLSFDHRAVDGAQASRFMNTLIKHLEDPGLLLLDVV